MATHGQLRDHLDPLRRREAREARARVRLERICEVAVLARPARGGGGVEDHEGHRALAPARVLAAHDGDLEHVGVARQLCDAKSDIVHPAIYRVGAARRL